MEMNPDPMQAEIASAEFSFPHREALPFPAVPVGRLPWESTLQALRLGEVFNCVFR
jgi:hypothetical protein